MYAKKSDDVKNIQNILKITILEEDTVSDFTPHDLELMLGFSINQKLYVPLIKKIKHNYQEFFYNVEEKWTTLGKIFEYKIDFTRHVFHELINSKFYVIFNRGPIVTFIMNDSNNNYVRLMNDIDIKILESSVDYFKKHMDILGFKYGYISEDGKFIKVPYRSLKNNMYSFYKFFDIAIDFKTSFSEKVLKDFNIFKINKGYRYYIEVDVTIISSQIENVYQYCYILNDSYKTVVGISSKDIIYDIAIDFKKSFKEGNIKWYLLYDALYLCNNKNISYKKILKENSNKDIITNLEFLYSFIKNYLREGN